MSEVTVFRLFCDCEECKDGESHYDAVIGNYNHTPTKPIRVDVVVHGPEYDRLKAIEHAAFNVCRSQTMEYLDHAVNELMKACGVEK